MSFKSLVKFYYRLKYHKFFSHNNKLHLINTDLVDPENFLTMRKVRSLFEEKRYIDIKNINSLNEVNLAWEAEALKIVKITILNTYQ